MEWALGPIIAMLRIDELFAIDAEPAAKV